MKKKPLRLTINFSKDYEDVFHYLKSKENISKFICESVQIIINDEMKRDNFEEKVYEVLLKILEKENLQSCSELKSITRQKKLTFFDEEIDILNNLFG